MPDNCPITGCDRPVEVREWCNKHYRRQLRGEPFLTWRDEAHLRNMKDGTSLVPIGDGQYAIVSPEDYLSVSGHAWKATNGYVSCRMNSKIMYLHRFILKPPRGMDVDHINHDRLDNRRENLRVCTRSQNLANSRGRRAKQFPYKGIARMDSKNGWAAMICQNYKTIHIGAFSTAREAALAYDRKAIELFGSFACLNFPKLSTREEKRGQS